MLNVSLVHNKACNSKFSIGVDGVSFSRQVGSHGLACYLNFGAAMSSDALVESYSRRRLKSMLQFDTLALLDGSIIDRWSIQRFTSRIGAQRHW